MIVSPYLERLFTSHQFQGNSNNCGPYCTAASINALKLTNVKGTDLSGKMEKIHWKKYFPIVRRIKNWATFPWGIQDILKEENINSTWLVFNKIGKLINLIPEDNLVIVIVGNYFPTWAHYKLLGAFDPNIGFGFIDSAYNNHNLQWETMEKFCKQWKNFGNQIIRVFPIKADKK